MFSNVLNPLKIFATILFFFSLSLSAQVIENIPMPPAEAEPLIVEDWGPKRKAMKNFTLDILRIESVNLIAAQKIPEITRYKFYKGNNKGSDIILTVGVDDKGIVYGDYFITTFSDRVGPCPNTCD